MHRRGVFELTITFETYYSKTVRSNIYSTWQLSGAFMSHAAWIYLEGQLSKNLSPVASTYRGRPLYGGSVAPDLPPPSPTTTSTRHAARCLRINSLHLGISRIFLFNFNRHRRGMNIASLRFCKSLHVLQVEARFLHFSACVCELLVVYNNVTNKLKIASCITIVWNKPNLSTYCTKKIMFIKLILLFYSLRRRQQQSEILKNRYT